MLWILLLAFSASASAFTGTLTTCQCAGNTKVWDIYSSTDKAGTFTPQCIADHACYATCDTDPCVTPKITCLPVASTKVKPGDCPKLDYPNWYNAYDNVKQCNDDSECEGKEKCCATNPTKQKKCVIPNGTNSNKCGTCNTNLMQTITSCNPNPAFYEAHCLNDLECSGDNKCCTCPGHTVSKCVGGNFLNGPNLLS